MKMVKISKIILIIIFVLILSAESGFCFWVWSSKTGKWVNPIYKVFDTPEEQFNWAKKYLEEKDYQKAIFEFKKVIKNFPSSDFTPEAHFYIGLCEEKLGRYYKAFQTYQSIIETYPLNVRLDEIVEKQYLLGEIFFKRKNYELAKQIFQKALQNSLYSKVSDVVQYKIGLSILKMNQFSQAQDEFKKVGENYSFSPYLDDAEFQFAYCSFKISSLVRDYDEELLDKAISDLEYFLRQFSTSEYVQKAESLLKDLNHKKAEKLYKIARFYEKQKKEYAATKYYEEVEYSYKKTSWAEKAKAKLENLRRR